MGFKKIFSILLPALLLTGCSSWYFNTQGSAPLQVPQKENVAQAQLEKNKTEKAPVEQTQNKIVPEESPQSLKPSQELDNLFAQSEEFFKEGIKFSDKGDWKQAEDVFESALECLQNSPLRDKYPDEVNKFYNKLVEDILIIVAKKEEPDEKRKESILSAQIKAKPEEEMTIKEKIMLDLQEASFDVPVEINQKVIDYVEYFAIEKKESMARWLARSNLYLPILQKIFSEEGLPLDLTYLPIIESAFNPDAYSYAKACGLWQFIPGTANKYGLKINWWIDERKDFKKATYAAAKYLKFLYEQFNDWRLALAAYNTGEGRIAKEIQRQNTTNFWEMSLHPQTMNYIPAYMASVIIAKNPKRYGFDIEYEPSLEYDEVVVQNSVDLKTLAECAETTRGTLKKLNPELRSWTTPPNTKSYVLRIPAGSKEKFETEIAKVHEKVKVAWGNYRIGRNESLSKIAHKFNIPIKALMEANSIYNPNKVAVGQRIIVPNRYEAVARASSQSHSRVARKSTSQNNDKLVIYTVKKSDTLTEIARLYGVSVSNIKKWNNLKNVKILSLNQKLKIYSYKASAEESTRGKTSLNKVKDSGDNFKEIIYVVKKGDTLWNIAKSYNIPPADIIAINKISAKSTITPGDKLKLKIPQEL